MPHMLPQ
jgi:hypothetical protein